MLQEKLFDLQLFAEEEVNGVQPVTDTPEQQDQGEADGDSLDFDIAIDDDGNVVFMDDEEEAPQQEQPQEQQPQTYKVKVNGEEVEVPLDELLNGYMRQAAFTQKTQEVAAMRKQMEQQMMQFQQPQQQQQMQQQQIPQQPEFTQRQYYEQLYGVAKSSVEKAFEENFDEFNPLHVAALADEVASIKAHVIQQQQYQNSLNNVLGKYTNDPEWQEIDRYALEKLNTMPYAIATQVKQRIDSGDLAFIDGFLGHVKNEYYGMKNPQVQQQQISPQQKPKPPFMESGGSGEQPQTPTTRKVDLRNIGKMKMDDQVKMFEKLGLTNL